MSGQPESNVVLLRGDRYCTKCKEETAHVADRCMSPMGRRLLWLTPIVLAAPIVHSALDNMPDRTVIRVIYWVLPVIIAVILVGMAASRKAYLLRCQRCRTESLRLTAPRWTGHSNIREQTS